MKKIYIIIISMLFWMKNGKCQIETVFYETAITTLDGYKMNLSDLVGKKTIVAILGPTLVDTSFVKKLDSFYRQRYTDITVIGLYSGAGKSVDSMLIYLRTVNISFPVTNVINVGKTTQKIAPIKWLMSANNKAHYDISGVYPGDIYLISENGVLFGRLPSSTDLFSEKFNVLLSRKISE